MTRCECTHTNAHACLHDLLHRSFPGIDLPMGEECRCACHDRCPACRREPCLCGEEVDLATAGKETGR